MSKTTGESIRIDKLLSTLACGTRAQVQDMIRNGRITMNGQTIRRPELHVCSDDVIALDGRRLDTRLSRHIMLYKPCGVLTAARDPKQQTVLDLLPTVYQSLGCMPVGRLDKDTEGLLLLTTDGTLAHQLLSPKRHVWKTYLAAVDGPLTPADAEAFESGIELSDFRALPARLKIIRSNAEQAEGLVQVCEGKFHQVRRMFQARGRTVITLKRLSVGPIELDDALLPGEYRELTDHELSALRRAVAGDTYAE